MCVAVAVRLKGHGAYSTITLAFSAAGRPRRECPLSGATLACSARSPFGVFTGFVAMFPIERARSSLRLRLWSV
jgi:hypothetical protein